MLQLSFFFLIFFSFFLVSERERKKPYFRILSFIGHDKNTLSSRYQLVVMV